MNEYDNDERLADNALDLWLSNPSQHMVTLCHRTNDAIDDHGNVLGGFTVSRERSGWHLSLYSVTGCMYSATLTDRWQEKVLTDLSQCSKLIAGQQAAAKSNRKNFQKPLASPKDFNHTKFTPNETGNKPMSNFQHIINQFTQCQCLPVMELETKNGHVVVDLSISTKGDGLLFELSGDYDLDDATYFSGEVEDTGSGIFFYPFDEYFDSLDHYLQEIFAEVNEGYIVANDKIKTED